MNKNVSVSIADWTARTKQLIDRVRQLCDKEGIDINDFPHEVFEGSKPVSLVFAGQYSAGKSTILKALTGIKDIDVGEGITTQELHSYNWNGIEVIDTPGIHTSLRPDHDDISYQAITNADMLVYVVTQELFDDFIGQNFRKLLIDKDKAAEMILIVNKMADIGNTIKNQEIKLNDLKKVTAPYTPDQLRTVFVDAESYLDGLSESDTEFAEKLYARSNYDMLVATLNDFVQDKNVSARLTTVLYKIYDYLQKALQMFQPSTGDSDVDALEEHLSQEHLMVMTTKRHIESAVKSIVENTVSKISEKGREIANTVYDYDTEDDANKAINKARSEAQNIASASADEVIQCITKLSKRYEFQLEELYKSDFSRDLRICLQSKKAKGTPIIQWLYNSDVFTLGSKSIIGSTIGTNVTSTGLKAFSGSAAHQMVKNVGAFFGHSFKPWEALKWTKCINKAGKIMGLFGVVFLLGMQIKEDIDADKRQQEMRSNREKLRAGFSEFACEVETYYNKVLGEFLLENYDAKIGEIDKQIAEIKKMRHGKSETCKLLENAQTDCRQLISDIHNSYSKDLDT